MRDIIGIIGFIILIIGGAWLINNFLFRSFDVTGPSMQPTLFTGDRVIVSRLPHTKSLITGEPHIPARGEIIVFENPQANNNGGDKFLVKRVIAFPGERVVVSDGVLTVYNAENPNGFEPDTLYPGPKDYTSGQSNTIVPDGQLYVAGDNRIGNFSLDSRNGLGTVPFDLIQGPVELRIFPFTSVRFF